MRQAWVACLLTTALLAGCSADAGDDPPADLEPVGGTPPASPQPGAGASPASPASPGAPPPGSPAPAKAGNRAPTLTASASVDGLNVTVEVSGSDPDGDDLLWSVTFGDGEDASGVSLPAAANHTYAEAGVYNLTVTLTDGAASASETLQANVTALGSAVTSYACTVAAALVVVNIEGGDTNVGTCTLGTLPGPGLVKEAAPAEGCAIQAGDAAVAVGTLYPEGTTFKMVCEAPAGATGGEGAVQVQG